MKRKIPEDPYEDSKKSLRSLFGGIHVLRCLVLILLLGNLLLLYAIFFSSQGIPGYRQQREQMKELEAKILNLKRENQRLFDKIVSFKNDPLAQERQVRQELGWVREGEIMIEFGAPDKEDSKKK